MADSLVVVHGLADYVDNLTRFTPMIGSSLRVGATESVEAGVIREAGDLKNLYVRVTANTITATPSAVFTVQKGAADTSVSVSYGSDETGVKEDTSNTAAYASGDTISMKCVTTTEAATNTATCTAIAWQFTPTNSSNCYTPLRTGSAGSNFATASVTRWIGLAGPPAAVSGTENDNVQHTIRSSFTASHLYVNVTANARTTNTVYSSRKNAGAGGQSVTFAAAETGLKHDTSGTDSLVAGDKYNYAITTLTGTETITTNYVGSRLVSTANQFMMVVSAVDTGVAQTFNTTVNWGLGSTIADETATESSSFVVPRLSFTAKELAVSVSANTIATSATTFKFRKGGADAGPNVSYAAAGTGVQTDTSTTTDITGGTDSVNFQAITPNTSGSITWRWATLIGEVAAVAGRTTKNTRAFPLGLEVGMNHLGGI
jgi:hypothetical protein